MERLRGRGVTFEEYDFPGLKTENGIATTIRAVERLVPRQRGQLPLPHPAVLSGRSSPERAVGRRQSRHRARRYCGGQ